MRGRGRGGRGRGGRGDDFGVPRIGPITEEQPAYPPNPRFTQADTQLGVEQQCLVALNRILINYWKFQSPFQVQDKPERPTVQTFTDSEKRTAAADPQRQKDLIINYTGSSYFPEELLNEFYIPPTRRKGLRPAQLKSRQGTEKGDGEKGEQTGGGTGLFDDEDGVGGDEPEDFGGDDYAHDHYADEDRDDDMFDDGGGGEDVF